MQPVLFGIQSLIQQPVFTGEARRTASLPSAADSVLFGATASYKGFRPQDVAWMRRDMEKSTYAKDVQEMIDSPTFRTSWDPEKNEVTLHNIRLPAREDNYQGVCDDLPRHMLLRLQKQFGERYTFEIVGANDDKYFAPGWEHYVILAWPKNRDAEVRQSLDAEVEKASKKEPSQFPKGVLLIDPSLHNFGMPGKDLHNYTLNKYTVNTIKPDDVLAFSSPERQYTGGTSLGYWKDLDPYHDPEYADAVMMVAFRREKAGDSPEIIFKIQPEGDQTSYAINNWGKFLDKNSPLKKLAERIRADLRAQA